MGGKGGQVQDDVVSINVTRKQAKDLIVALTHALQSGGKKEDAVTAKK